MEDFSTMRFTATRLCGGIDLVVTPERPIPIDIDRVHDQMGSEYQRNGGYVNFDWNGYFVTLYPAGSVMVFHVPDKIKAIEMARRILSDVYDEDDAEKIGHAVENV